MRLTINSASIADYALTKDGSKLFYFTEFEKGYDLWYTVPRTKETKILAKLGADPGDIELSKDEKYIFVLNEGNLMKIDVNSGNITAIGTQGEIEWHTAAERRYIFDHIWLHVKKKFYDPSIHNVDWELYYKTLRKVLRLPQVL